MNNFVVCLPKNGQLVNDFSSFSLSKSLERIRSSLNAKKFICTSFIHISCLSSKTDCRSMEQNFFFTDHFLFSNDVNEKANIDFSSHQKNNNQEYKKKSFQLVLLSP